MGIKGNIKFGYFSGAEYWSSPFVRKKVLLYVITWWKKKNSEFVFLFLSRVILFHINTSFFRSWQYVPPCFKILALRNTSCIQLLHTVLWAFRTPRSKLIQLWESDTISNSWTFPFISHFLNGKSGRKFETEAIFTTGLSKYLQSYIAEISA